MSILPQTVWVQNDPQSSLNLRRTSWVQSHPYFHLNDHNFVNINRLAMKFYDFVNERCAHIMLKNGKIWLINKQINNNQSHRILPVRRGCKTTHTLKEGTLRAVYRGCKTTHALKEGTLRAVHRGCKITHTHNKEICACMSVSKRNLQSQGNSSFPGSSHPDFLSKMPCRKFVSPSLME